MAVLHQAVAQGAEESPGPPCLAEQPRLAFADGALGQIGEQPVAAICSPTISPRPLHAPGRSGSDSLAGTER